jgi:hypothetical protein
MAAAVANQGGYPSAGMVTTHLLLPALTSIGRSDLAYQMLAKTNYPSWGYEVGIGATTPFELWNSVNSDGTVNTNQDGMNSLNHANFGACAEWFYRGILGINQLAPGFSAILVAPQVGGGLTSAQGVYDSIQGPIASAWQLTNNTLTLNVTIPANTTAEIQVPTTNAGAITESGVSAASSRGVTYVGVSNNAAVYTVGSGNYSFLSPYSVPVPPITINIATTNQTGTGTGTFYPSWTFVTTGSLIAGQLPSSMSGNFSEEAPGRSVGALTTSHSLGITLITNAGEVSSSTNYVTCGNGSGAGASLVYTLTGSTNGYMLTNITVYGGWANNGRDQQAYTVYYSTVAAPTNFIMLAVVNYTPSVASGIQSATQVTLTSPNGVLASNVAEVKFDFTSPASENGYCGYAGINVFGIASISPAAPAAMSAALLAPNSFVIDLGLLVAGRNYMIQSTTNLASGIWTTETNFVAGQSAAAFTNLISNYAETFYRVVGY